MLNDNLERGFIVFIIFLLIGLNSGISPFLGFNYIFTLFSVGLFFYGLKTAMPNRGKILAAILTSALAVSVMALFQKIGISIFNVKFVTANRITGTFFNANRLAGYLGLTLLPAVSFSLKKKWAWVLSALILLAILFTKSRGGLLFIYAALNIFAYLNWHNRKKFRVSIVLFNIILLFVFFQTPYSSRFKTNILKAHNVRQREVIWWTALRMLQDHPLFGIGAGAFPMSFEHYRTPFVMKFVPTTDSAFHAHNDYLQILAETGIIGLSLVLFALLIFFKKMKVRTVYDRAAVAVVCSMLFYELVDFNLQIMPTLILFLTLIFLLFYLKAPSQVQQRKSSFVVLGVSLIFLLLLQLVNFRLAQAAVLFKKGNAFEQIDKNRALNYYTRVLKLNPYYEYYHAFAGHTLADLGRNSKAVYQYRYAAKLNKFKMSYFANLAILYYKQGRIFDAVWGFEKGVEAEPYKPQAWNKLALMSEYLGDYKKAYFAAQRMLFYFNDPAAVDIIFNSMQKLGWSVKRKWKTALSLFRFQKTMRTEIISKMNYYFGVTRTARFLENNATNHYLFLGRPALIKIGDDFSEVKKYKKAFGFYKRALKMGKDSNIYFKLGVAAYYSAQTNAALNFFKKSVELDPHNKSALRNIHILQQKIGVRPPDS